MAQVSLQDVTKQYPGGRRALDSLSLDIRSGELLVLAGPSGSGKSTVLRLIAGLERPTTGVVSIGGASATHLAPHQRNVAMVFQSHALYPHMSARRNIAFALRGRGVSRAEIDRSVRDVARSLELDECLDRSPGRLSGGERQRVALARAIVRSPDVFLLDEPLSSLDPPLRAAARAQLKAVQRRTGTTTIHVTHDPEEAMALADRLAVLGGGTLQQIAPPLEVYNRPANRFVAALIGAPGMNLVEGSIASESGALWFLEPGHSSARIQLPPSHHAALERCVDRACVLGVRPAHILPPGATPASTRTTLPLTPTLAEPLGDHILLHARTRGGQTVLVKLPSPIAPPPIGSERTFSVDPSDLHWFAPGPFGRNLTSAPP